MPPALIVDDHGLGMKAGDYSFEVVLVEGPEVPADDVFFSSSHVSLRPRPVVLGPDNKDKFIAHSGRQTFLARPKSMPADDPKIELAFPDSSLDGLRIGDLELHIYARVFGPKRRNDSGQHVEPRSRAGADQERPMSQAIQLSERLTPALNRGDGTLRKLRDD